MADSVLNAPVLTVVAPMAVEFRPVAVKTPYWEKPADDIPFVVVPNRRALPIFQYSAGSAVLLEYIVSGLSVAETLRVRSPAMFPNTASPPVTAPVAFKVVNAPVLGVVAPIAVEFRPVEVSKRR